MYHINKSLFFVSINKVNLVGANYKASFPFLCNFAVFLINNLSFFEKASLVIRDLYGILYLFFFYFYNKYEN